MSPRVLAAAALLVGALCVILAAPFLLVTMAALIEGRLGVAALAAAAAAILCVLAALAMPRAGRS